MNLLLDTHVVIWWALNSRKLLGEAREAISSADRVLVSAASAWEIAIKSALGRIHLKDPLSVVIQRSGFEPLAISFDHAERLSGLPAHHSDPFDRLLLVQALVEGLTMVSHDRVLQAYAVPIIWT